MVSVPRDSASYPLYFGGKVSNKVRINSLPTYVRNGWVDFPGRSLHDPRQGDPVPGGHPDQLLRRDGPPGVRPDGGHGRRHRRQQFVGHRRSAYATPGGQIIGFKLAAGPQHLNGDQALAYVRSRHGAGNNDWAREGRQQQVMAALLHKMSEPGAILELPNLMSKLSASISTTFPRAAWRTTFPWARRAELQYQASGPGSAGLHDHPFERLQHRGDHVSSQRQGCRALGPAVRQRQPLVRKARSGEYLLLAFVPLRGSHG